MNAKHYDQELRAVGQALETQAITVFEMKTETDHYIVNGKPERPSSLLGILRQLHKLGWKPGPRTMTLGPQEIASIERRGRTQRKNPDSLPDFYSLANTLRTVGAYLNSKNADLLGMQKRPLTVTLLYQSDRGHPHVEDRTIASFYEIFVELYGRRSRDARPAPRPNPKTLSM
jgi:hypothetical protein